MDNEWLWAAVAVGAGLIVGVVAARIVRATLSNEKRPEAIQGAAAPVATLFFSGALIVGLMTALGIVDEDALSDLPTSLVDYIPRALSAGIVLIIANVASSFLATALDRSLGHVSADLRRRVPLVVRGALLGAGGLIAANQLGVDTTILTIAAASLFFSIGLASALMVGLGSREVSGEVAAGRALRRLLSVGDHVTVGDRAGTVVEIHSVAVEFSTDDDQRFTLPNSMLLESSLEISRAASGA